MSSWWQSLDTIERLSHGLNWGAAVLTALAAVTGIAALVVAGRASTLRSAKEIQRESEIARLTQDLQQAREMAAPTRLVYRAHAIATRDNHLELKVQFEPTKNQVLGEIQFTIELAAASAVRIVKVWPALEGGAFLSGDDSTKIATDGRSATLTYALMGPGRPTFDLEVTGECQVIIGGNHLGQPVRIDVRAPA